MKTYLILLLALLAVGWGSPPPKVLEVTLPEIIVEDTSRVETSKAPFLTVKKCDGCSVLESDFIKSAVAKVNEVVVGACFRKEMAAMSLIQTEGRTPEQVVDSLVGVQVDTEMYWTIKRVLGYTYPSVDKIWINRRYMKSWGVCELGSLLSHESSHKVGYKHDFKPTERRPQSVPYSINRAFKACCH